MRVLECVWHGEVSWCWDGTNLAVANNLYIPSLVKYNYQSVYCLLQGHTGLYRHSPTHYFNIQIHLLCLVCSHFGWAWQNDMVRRAGSQGRLRAPFVENKIKKKTIHECTPPILLGSWIQQSEAVKLVSSCEIYIGFYQPNVSRILGVFP